MSSKLKTAIIVDDSLIFDGNTIDAINHTNPLEDAQDQLREGQLSVSSADTHVKHLEDAVTGASGKVTVTKQNAGANESLEIDLDATGVTSGYVPTANGAGGWSWSASGGGGASPVDVTGTAGEGLSERDYVYLDESSGTWFKVDIDATPILCGRVRGVVNEAGGILSASTGSIRLIGEVSGYAGLTAWQPVYAHSTAGGITQTRPSPVSGGAQVAVIPIGIAITATNIVVLPQQPAQYMKRDTVANDGTLTITHHTDEMAHLRRAFAYIGSSESGAVAVQYASSNQDTGVNLRDQTPATYGSDVTTSGFAIASGTGAGSAGAAFDNTGAEWFSNQAGAANNNVSYIGQNFGASNDKAIRRVNVDQRVDYYASAYDIQYSDDGSSWTTALSVTGADDTATDYDLPDVGAHRYWRILCIDASPTTATYWSVSEIAMYEVATPPADGADKLSQTFTLASDTDVSAIDLYLKKTGSPTGTATVRIETLSASQPSGTLAHASATATFSESSLGTSYADTTITFASSFTLTAGSYAIVLSTDRTASETDYITWGADGSAPSYAGGEMFSEASATWSAESKDAIFAVRSPGTTFIEPAVTGRWSGGTRDIAIRYDDGAGADGNTKTTCKNVIGASADVTLVVEIP